MNISVKVVTKNRPNETVVITFTNRKAADDFNFMMYDRDDVISWTMGNAVKTHSNVERAIKTLNSWSS